MGLFCSLEVSHCKSEIDLAENSLPREQMKIPVNRAQTETWMAPLNELIYLISR